MTKDQTEELLQLISELGLNKRGPDHSVPGTGEAIAMAIGFEKHGPTVVDLLERIADSLEALPKIAEQLEEIANKE